MENSQSYTMTPEKINDYNDFVEGEVYAIWSAGAVRMAKFVELQRSFSPSGPNIVFEFIPFPSEPKRDQPYQVFKTRSMEYGGISFYKTQIQ